MLKKAGILVAASAASLLAVSPMAFAADGGDGDKGGHKGSENGIDKSAEGLVSGLNGNDINVPVQACNNNVPVNVLGVQVPVEDAAGGNGLNGALGVLGKAQSKSGDSVTDQSDSCGQQSGAGDTAR